jgi:hypothetical protein
MVLFQNAIAPKAKIPGKLPGRDFKFLISQSLQIQRRSLQRQQQGHYGWPISGTTL